MKTDQFKSYQIADIGDYLKVFACSAVISQPIMSLVMDVEQPVHTQDVFGVFYNLVKYTAQLLFLVFCIPQSVLIMKK